MNTKKKRPWKKTKNKFRRKTIAKSIHRPISTGWPARAKKRESVRSRKGSVTNHWPKDGLTANIPAHEASSVHYTGRTTDGRIFDDTRGGIPAALRLSDLIDGWIIALQRMCIGDRWEIYIPAEMGYGKFSQPGIPGGSTLIFDIELLGIA